MRIFIIFTLLAVALAQTPSPSGCDGDGVNNCYDQYTDCTGGSSDVYTACNCLGPYIGCLGRVSGCESSMDGLMEACESVCSSSQCNGGGADTGSSTTSGTGNKLSGESKALIAGAVSGAALLLIFMGILALIIVNSRKHAANSSQPHHQSMPLQVTPYPTVAAQANPYPVFTTTTQSSSTTTTMY
eukprot:TRINITY_DN6466_c0_g1_i1.p1 TRINITY_DN6466_c0_g1~~TRINITY_DN6466_c0_g1_i1.p1  ORF type:complete len:186 (+),score=13.26 TRINITY_DN6466_c0_g1_i1:215-772(+)